MRGGNAEAVDDRQWSGQKPVRRRAENGHQPPVVHFLRLEEARPLPSAVVLKQPGAVGVHRKEGELVDRTVMLPAGIQDAPVAEHCGRNVVAKIERDLLHAAAVGVHHV